MKESEKKLAEKTDKLREKEEHISNLDKEIK